MNAIPTDLHCGFHFLALLYLPPKSEVDVLGTCLWPRVVGRERSGRVASECRTSRAERPKAGAQQGNLFLPKTPISLPREDRSLKSFPCAQILEQVGLSGIKRPRPLPFLGSQYVTSTVKTYQKRIIKIVIHFKYLHSN